MPGTRKGVLHRGIRRAEHGTPKKALTLKDKVKEKRPKRTRGVRMKTSFLLRFYAL